MSQNKLDDKLDSIVKQQHDIDKKLTQLCTNVRHIMKSQATNSDRLNNLPCDSHSQTMLKEIDSRVSWKVFWGITALLIMVILGGFTYSNTIEHELHDHMLDSSEINE